MPIQPSLQPQASSPPSPPRSPEPALHCGAPLPATLHHLLAARLGHQRGHNGPINVREGSRHVSSAELGVTHIGPTRSLSAIHPAIPAHSQAESKLEHMSMRE